MSEPAVAESAPPAPVQSQVRLALITVFLVYLGVMTLNPIIAPLSREVGLEEWQIGLMVSIAALCMVVSSQFWGRKSRSWGRKPVLITTISAATIAMVAFAVLAQLGMIGIVSGVILFAGFLITRGLMFGLSVAAVLPTVQAYIADVTPTEESRVRGLAGTGAVQGLAMMAGAVSGGLLAGFGLIVPLIFVPVILAASVVVIAVFLRKEERHELLEDPPHVSPFDTRVWPFLLAGFGMFTALGFIQIITGFVIQDRFALDAQTTAVVTGLSLVGAGLGITLAQGVIVPRTKWHPYRLLRVGSIVAFLGFALFIPNWGIPVVILSIFLTGLGLGIAIPGYSAGPTLLMTSAEQGGMAGLIGANNALTFVVAPTLATSLYSAWNELPLIASAAMMVLVGVFVFVHPRFRHPRA